MKMQVSREPMALWMMSEVTSESTPPESPQMTLPSPTVCRISLTLRATNEEIDQSALRPLSRKRKLLRTLIPSLVWMTSGWNWTPKNFLALSSITAARVLAVLPVRRKPGGTHSSRSPWLIQTCSRSLTLARSPDVSRTRRAAKPYSPSLDGMTWPPRWWAMRWTP